MPTTEGTIDVDGAEYTITDDPTALFLPSEELGKLSAPDLLTIAAAWAATVSVSDGYIVDIARRIAELYFLDTADSEADLPHIELACLTMILERARSLRDQLAQLEELGAEPKLMFAHHSKEPETEAPAAQDAPEPAGCSPHEARCVLSAVGESQYEGYSSHFITALVHAMLFADAVNLARLGESFPGLVWAVSTYSESGESGLLRIAENR